MRTRILAQGSSPLIPPLPELPASLMDLQLSSILPQAQPHPLSTPEDARPERTGAIHRRLAVLRQDGESQVRTHAPTWVESVYQIDHRAPLKPLPFDRVVQRLAFAVGDEYERPVSIKCLGDELVPAKEDNRGNYREHHA